MENIEKKIYEEESITPWDKANELPDVEIEDFKEERIEDFFNYVEKFEKKGEDDIFLIIIGNTLAFPKKFKSKDEAQTWIKMHPMDVIIKTAIIATKNATNQNN